MANLPRQYESERQFFYDYGLNDQQISNAVGVTDSCIRYWRKRNNLPPNRRPNGSRTVRERLHDMIEEDDDGCWIWQGNLNGEGQGYGYGRMWFGDKSKMAHKVSYRIHKGEVPDGLVVRHLCHRPACVNPDHLELGTMKDNMLDSIQAGRVARGTDQHLSKLDDEKVLLIRRLYAQTGLTTYDLASEFGVSRPCIGYVVRGDTWTHVGGPLKN